jgi:conjugal transfer pilus assembly protein TraV
MSRRTRIALMLGLLAATSACTTLGANVSGDFACRAPSGSCAPMSAIDDRAVEGLGTSNDSSLSTAAEQPHLIGSPRAGTMPARTGERTLTIIFPAYVDAAGVLHDEARAHAVAERPSWTFEAAADGSPPSSEISRSSAPSSLREAIAGSSPPAIEGLEFPPAQAPHLPDTGASALRPSSAQPSVEALSAARAGNRIARPSVMTATPAAPPADVKTKQARLPTRVLPVGSQEAAKRVRQMARPALDEAGRRKDDPDLGSVFAPVQSNPERPQ